MPLRSVNLHTIMNSICLDTAPTHAVEVSQPAHNHELNVLTRPLLMPLRSVNLHTLMNSICLVTAPTHAVEISQPAHTHELNMS